MYPAQPYLKVAARTCLFSLTCQWQQIWRLEPGECCAGDSQRRKEQHWRSAVKTWAAAAALSESGASTLVAVPGISEAASHWLIFCGDEVLWCAIKSELCLQNSMPKKVFFTSVCCVFIQVHEENIGNMYEVLQNRKKQLPSHEKKINDLILLCITPDAFKTCLKLIFDCLSYIWSSVTYKSRAR